MEDRHQSVRLLERARARDREALDALFEKFAGKLMALIRLRLGPELRRQIESRDIFQEVMLKACLRIEQFRGEGSTSFSSWLARIAENEIRDQGVFYRRARRDALCNVTLDEHRSAARKLAAEIRSASSRLLLCERAEKLERALESLPEIQRETVVLRRLEELSFVEIGERLGKSPDACRMTFARAMASLTRKMMEMDL